jgi:hypothetical protein
MEDRTRDGRVGTNIAATGEASPLTISRSEWGFGLAQGVQRTWSSSYAQEKQGLSPAKPSMLMVVALSPPLIPRLNCREGLDAGKFLTGSAIDPAYLNSIGRVAETPSTRTRQPARPSR